jgi:pimeloyl-ACP methyl ester carboxylesterase
MRRVHDDDRWTLRRRFRYQRSDIAFDVFGSDGGAAVLVHGFPGNSFAWREVAPRLARTRRVYVVDMLGFGQSAKDEDQDVSPSAQARLFAALLEHWQLEAPDVVAHDIGASFVLGAALFEGCRVGHIVLVDAAVLTPCISENSMHARRFLEAYQTMPSALHATILRSHIPTTMHTPMSDETFAGYFSPWKDTKGQAAYYRFLAQLDESYLDRIQAALGRLDLPTRIIWGSEDHWIPPSHGTRLAKLIPGSELILIPDAGHFIADDAPGPLTEDIEAFLT